MMNCPKKRCTKSNQSGLFMPIRSNIARRETFKTYKIGKNMVTIESFCTGLDGKASIAETKMIARGIPVQAGIILIPKPLDNRIVPNSSTSTRKSFIILLTTLAV